MSTLTCIQPAAANVTTEDDARAARLRWLNAALAYHDYRRYLFRTPREEEEMSLMRSPIRTEQAYGYLGAMLGLFPPVAIFSRFLVRSYSSNNFFSMLLVCLVMTLICFVTGWKMGQVLGRNIDRIERRSWSMMLFCATLTGITWGIVTGAAGGVLVFIIGALFGMICAVPVGALGFLAFTVLHRPLARGGMIDERHFWPVASGIVFSIVAAILSPYLF